MEKTKRFNIGTLLVLGFMAVIAFWLLGSLFGVFSNYLGWDARQAGILGKIVAVVILLLTALMWVGLTRNPQEKLGGFMVATFALLVIASLSAIGFREGTAGDIKQTITYLDAHGKVANKDILFNCYDGFYKFSSDPDLKKYVETYGELPGRNNWNYFIRSGKIPKSTAPRADEDFEWHTGAYEGKIPKDCK